MDTSHTPRAAGEYKNGIRGDDLSPGARMVGLIDSSLKIELAVGYSETPFPNHCCHCHIHQLPVVETSTIQVQLPEHDFFKLFGHSLNSPGIVQACHIVPQGSKRMVAVDIKRHI